jgi:hypothetical protein
MPIDSCIGVRLPREACRGGELETSRSCSRNSARPPRRQQIFYDNEAYFRFVKTCRDKGVTIPIIPGLKILTRPQQVQLVPKHFGATIPERLVEEIMAVPADRAVDVGTRWALEQTRDLLDHGVPSVHFYVMQNTAPFVAGRGATGPVAVAGTCRPWKPLPPPEFRSDTLGRLPACSCLLSFGERCVVGTEVLAGTGRAGRPRAAR